MVQLKIITNTCISLRQLPLVLPTNGPVPRVLGCGLMSYFGESKIPISAFMIEFYISDVSFIAKYNVYMP